MEKLTFEYKKKEHWKRFHYNPTTVAREDSVLKKDTLRTDRP